MGELIPGGKQGQRSPCWGSCVSSLLPVMITVPLTLAAGTSSNPGRDEWAIELSQQASPRPASPFTFHLRLGETSASPKLTLHALGPGGAQVAAGTPTQGSSMDMCVTQWSFCNERFSPLFPLLRNWYCAHLWFPTGCYRMQDTY